MANHLRRQIRDAIVTAVTSLTTTGTSVFTNVVYDVSRVTLPALLVRVGHEESVPAAFGVGRAGAKYERKCFFDVVACAEDNSDCDAALIAIAKEVEEALAVAAGPWSDLILVGSLPELDGSAQKPRGTLTLRFQAIYYTRRDRPDLAA